MSFTIQKRMLPAGLSLLLVSAGCSDDSSSTSAVTTTVGSGGGSSQGGATSVNTTSTSSVGGGSSSGGSSGTSSAGAAGLAGAAGATTGSFSELGVCGQRSEGSVTLTSFETYEEFYLLGDKGRGDEICVVRFDLTRVGNGPEGCDQFAGQQEACLWTHLVEYGNPRVLLDQDGVCEHSELAMGADAILELDGTQVAYGYVFEYQGHNSTLLKLNEATGEWVPLANAGWGEESSDFRFDRRAGFCGY